MKRLKLKTQNLFLVFEGGQNRDIWQNSWFRWRISAWFSVDYIWRYMSPKDLEWATNNVYCEVTSEPCFALWRSWQVVLGTCVYTRLALWTKLLTLWPQRLVQSFSSNTESRGRVVLQSMLWLREMRWWWGYIELWAYSKIVTRTPNAKFWLIRPSFSWEVFLLPLCRIHSRLEKMHTKPLWNIISYTLGWPVSKEQKLCVGKDVELEYLSIGWWSAKWYSHYRKQYGSLPKY